MLTFLKDLAQTFQGFGAAAVAFCAAWWFLQRRKRYPRATVTLEIINKKLENNWVLLKVNVTVANIGEVLLRLKEGYVVVNQIIPSKASILDSLSKEESPIDKTKGETEANWQEIDSYTLDWDESPAEIEPGESDIFNFDFFLKGEVKVISAEAYFTNSQKKPKHGKLGWGITFLHEVKLDEQTSATSTTADTTKGQNNGRTKRTR